MRISLPVFVGFLQWQGALGLSFQNKVNSERPQVCVKGTNFNHMDMDLNRRSVLQRAAWLTAGVVLGGAFPQSSRASLLEDFGDDPTKITSKEPVKEVVTPRTAVSKEKSVIEPNLRSNYYYPTNKKRYLPRIKKCNDAIPLAAASIGDGDWEAVTTFVNVADDTILPLKLYTSSLTGGGTNVKVSYTKTMSQCAKDFEASQKALVKAVSKKSQTESSKALEGMATALQTYRTVANLNGPDSGGDIPSVDDIRRSACRVQGRSFEKKVLERDARLKQAEMETKTTVSSTAK